MRSVPNMVVQADTVTAASIIIRTREQTYSFRMSLEALSIPSNDLNWFSAKFLHAIQVRQHTKPSDISKGRYPDVQFLHVLQCSHFFWDDMQVAPD